MSSMMAQSQCETHYDAQTDENKKLVLLVMAVGLDCCQSILDMILQLGTVKLRKEHYVAEVERRYKLMPTNSRSPGKPGKRSQVHQLKLWLERNPIEGDSNIAFVMTALERTCDTCFGFYQKQPSIEVKSLGQPLCEKDTLDCNSPSTKDAIVVADQTKCTPPELEGDPQDKLVESLDIHTLMARALGLAGCDFRESPFTRRTREFSPKRDTLHSEIRRRAEIMRFGTKHPNSGASKDTIINWLYSNPIQDEQEAKSLVRRVAKLKSELEAKRGARKPGSGEPPAMGHSEQRKPPFGGLLLDNSLHLVNSVGREEHQVAAASDFSLADMDKGTKLLQCDECVQPACDALGPKVQPTTIDESIDKQGQKDPSNGLSQQIDCCLDEHSGENSIGLSVQDSFSKRDAGADMKTSCGFADVRPMLLMARALGLDGCDFRKCPFRHQDIFELTPTDEILLAECKRRAAMLGMTWRELMINWLVNHPIQDVCVVWELLRQVGSLVARLKAELEPAKRSRKNGNGVAMSDTSPIAGNESTGQTTNLGGRPESKMQLYDLQANNQSIEPLNIAGNLAFDEITNKSGTVATVDLATESQTSASTLKGDGSDEIESSELMSYSSDPVPQLNINAASWMLNDSVARCSRITMEKNVATLDSAEDASNTREARRTLERDSESSFTEDQVNDTMFLSQGQEAICVFKQDGHEGASTKNSSGPTFHPIPNKFETRIDPMEISSLGSSFMKMSMSSCSEDASSNGSSTNPKDRHVTVRGVELAATRENQGTISSWPLLAFDFTVQTSTGDERKTLDEDSLSVGTNTIKSSSPTRCGSGTTTEIKRMMLVDRRGQRGCYSGACLLGESHDRPYTPHGQGTMEYESGIVYVGVWSNGFWHGYGRLDYGKNDYYTGCFRRGSFQDRGLRAYADGSEYEGWWKGGKRAGKGTFSNSEGDVFVGTWVNDELEGPGVKTSYDGSKYDGMFKGGLQQGHCRYRDRHGAKFEGEWVSKHEMPDGSRYDGIWKDGKEHGSGKRCSRNGEVYFGQYHHGVRHGLGRVSYPAGDYYDGSFVKDKKEGFGEFVWASGEKYTGQWHDGRQHGQGEWKHPNGDRYRGEYRCGLRHGHGIYTCADGSEYNGEFIGGKRQGKCKFRDNYGTEHVGEWTNHAGLDGSRYDGLWDDGKNEHGFGECWSKEGDFYSGHYRRGLRHGQGRLRYANGDIYHGSFVNGKKFGHGEFCWSDGYRRKYEGEWKGDEEHGKGILTYSDGATYIGQWRNGEKHGQGCLTLRNGSVVHDGQWEEGSPVR